MPKNELSEDYRKGFKDALTIARTMIQLEQSDDPDVVPGYQRALELIASIRVPTHTR